MSEPLRLGADPDRLLGYARAGGQLDHRLGELASVLRPAHGPAAGAPFAVLHDLADRLHALAQAERATSRWVGAVGRAFAAADERGEIDIVRAGPLSALVDLAVADVGSGAFRLAELERTNPDPALVRVAAATIGRRRLAQIARDRPALVGPVDGMPVPARYAANRVLLRQALGATDEPRRRATLHRLLRRDPRTGRPRQFLRIDPTGRGRLVEVFGELDEADAVAVLVPGVGTDLDHERLLARRATSLLAAARTLAPGTRTAVVSWLGYEPPARLRPDLASVAGVASIGAALDGGNDLARQRDGLVDGRDPRLVLIGHSYGSTVATAALAVGLRSDAVVALGSPGVIDGGSGTERYTMAARHDLIAHLGWFGPDPNRLGSGFRRLAADGQGHSSYFAPGSTSLRNLAAVVVGRRDLLVPAS